MKETNFLCTVGSKRPGPVSSPDGSDYPSVTQRVMSQRHFHPALQEFPLAMPRKPRNSDQITQGK